MQDLPHHYQSTVSGSPEGVLNTEAAGLTAIATAPPAEFGGPGDQWSPETLLMASIANCLILTFRAVSRASKLEWDSIECQANGTLERIDRITRFTEIEQNVTLKISHADDAEKAEKLLHKSEANCLISNSLSATLKLNVNIIS